jgi:hypothetical protein
MLLVCNTVDACSLVRNTIPEDNRICVVPGEKFLHSLEYSMSVHPSS